MCLCACVANTCARVFSVAQVRTKAAVVVGEDAGEDEETTERELALAKRKLSEMEANGCVMRWYHEGGGDKRQEEVDREGYRQRNSSNT